MTWESLIRNCWDQKCFGYWIVLIFASIKSGSLPMGPMSYHDIHFNFIFYFHIKDEVCSSAIENQTVELIQKRCAWARVCLENAGSAVLGYGKQNGWTDFKEIRRGDLGYFDIKGSRRQRRASYTTSVKA